MPRCCGPASCPGSAVKLGSRSRATLILHDALLYEMRPTASLNRRRQLGGSSNLLNVRWQSTPDGDFRGGNSSPFVHRDAVTRAVFDEDLGDFGFGANLDAEIFGRASRGLASDRPCRP